MKSMTFSRFFTHPLSIICKLYFNYEYLFVKGFLLAIGLAVNG